MEEWKFENKRNQSDWDDCSGCGSVVPVSMPSRALKDTWTAVLHKTDVCSGALSSRPIRRDACNIETWTGLSKTARTSPFFWDFDQDRWSSHDTPTCRKLKVGRSDSRARMEVEVYWMNN